MNYLEMVIKETLRKYPILSILDRRCNQNYQIPSSDVVIEAGTLVYVQFLGLHFDPKYFSNPDQFDPDRFSKENLSYIENCLYMPFGEGPRNCIGARFGLINVKLALVYAIKHFEVAPFGTNIGKPKYNPLAILISFPKEFYLNYTEIKN